MKRAISLVATVATLSFATAASGAEHTILILEDAYFPQITYLNEGDTVHFLNVSGVSHNVIAKNGSWEIGPITDEAQATMVIEAGVQKTFYNKDATSEDGSYVVEGKMSFSEPPVD